MTDTARLYTPAEAGAVTGLKLKAAHNAIDKNIVEPVAKVRVAPAGRVNRVSVSDKHRVYRSPSCWFLIDKLDKNQSWSAMAVAINVCKRPKARKGASAHRAQANA